jgi:ubiquinone/menaquinone biosynthesis C-methylase UbiE
MNTEVNSGLASSKHKAGVWNGLEAKKAMPGEYALATGPAAVRRLLTLHNIYAPAGRRVLLQAGLSPGMHVADFGCGIGAVTRMLAEMVGPSGSVTGVDANNAQLDQARIICRAAGRTNTSFVEADACATRLPRNSYDLVYCRFLLLHLPDPAACLREMRDVLKPGGRIVVEDGDLATAASLPPTAINAFADLFTRLGPTRGLDYSLSRNLYHMVKDAGFSDPEIEIHQPALTRGDNRFLLKWSVEEAGPAFVSAGLVTAGQLEQILTGMQVATEDPDVLILTPLMSLVWARKAL